MLHLVLSAALAPLVAAADAPLAAGTQLTFRGAVEPARQVPGQNGKSFDLTFWVVEQHDSQTEILWLVDERGRGAFPWTEHFGRLMVDAQWKASAQGPAVLYDWGDGRSPVSIPLPFLATDKPLAPEVEFQRGKLEYHVDGAAKLGGQPVWKVSARDSYGLKRMLMVEHDGPLVLAMTSKLTMGRGVEYQLSLEFVGTEQLSGEPLAAFVRAAEQLTTLRDKLALPRRVEHIEWKDTQLKQLQAALPALSTAAAATPVEKLVANATRDIELQSGRSDAVSELIAKFDGSQVEDFSAKGLGDAALARDDLADKVTVLHFWEYRDAPLEEPYGQVGYLDFLYHRRKDAGLQVYGVAVDGRLADPATRSAAERSVRKLKSFMNLSYPVLLDSGALVKQFGDPRLIGAKLPLFVVISPEGKILHYHVGHYEVDRDQGLKQLDEAVGKALEQK